MTTILKTNTRGAAARTAIYERYDFDSRGALYGRNVDPSYSQYSERGGWLRNGWLARFRREAPTYVVYSYDTPIAWWSEAHGWSRPDLFHSMTTSHHQSQCPQNESKDPA